MGAVELAGRLQDELCTSLDLPNLPLVVPAGDEASAWDASGARELTGFLGGPGLDVSGVPASATQAALAVVEAHLGCRVPGVEVLGERAAVLGLARNAPFSAGGAFRCVAARDGWFGVSLAREWDREVLPALVGSTVADDPWDALASWVAGVDAGEAVGRAVELQMAAAEVPSVRLGERRRPVEIARGGPRARSAHPVVVDLTALWAGPLCARLLGLGGARVIKVESVDRPDGARFGSPDFFKLMHAGHEFVQLDFATQSAELQALISTADVVLEASRPRALERLGISAREHVAAGTVWASITAYGRQGYDAVRIGFGDDVAAGAGLVRWTEAGPVPAGDALADPLAGVHAAAAVAVALRGNHGCLLDVSMHDVARRAAGRN